MRLIDADKIVYYESVDSDTLAGTGKFYAPRELIDAMPTTEERRRGEWIKEYWNGEHTRKCSACNITQTVTTYRGKVNFKYCPYCGADMRGEQDG